MSIYNEIFKRECETKFGTFVKYFIFFKKDDGGIESYQVYLTKEDYLKVKGGKKPEELQIPIETINFILHSKIPRDENGNIINTGYVTNATANSVVYFALSFLNSNFFSVEQIKRLRLKYSIGNFIDGRFNKDEILNSFLVQSAFLFKSSHIHDRKMTDLKISSMNWINKNFFTNITDIMILLHI